MGNTEYHVQIYKSENKTDLVAVYPITYGMDVQIDANSNVNLEGASNVQDVIMKLGKLAFSDDIDITRYGLKSAAFTSVKDYATAAQGIKADNSAQLDGAEFKGPVKLAGDPVNNTEAVTKQYVDRLVDDIKVRADGIVYKGSIGTGGKYTEVPTEGVTSGWMLKVIENGTYAGYECHVGDLLISTSETEWDFIPSGDENETSIAFSKTETTLTEEYSTGKILLGEASAYQVDTEMTEAGGDKLVTNDAVLAYLRSKGILEDTQVVTGVMGSKESDYRSGNVILTPENIGAATAEEGELAKTAIQRITPSVITGKAGDDASVEAITEGTATQLIFTIPRGDKGDPGTPGNKGEDGVRGSLIYQGTLITGTEKYGTVFADSTVEHALANDVYINTETCNMYQCILAGEPDVAQWTYIGCIKGTGGSGGDISDVLQLSETPPANDCFWFEIIKD